MKNSDRGRHASLFLWTAIAALAPLACQRTPTYYGDVAPILERRCVSCHGAAGLAAFPRLDGPQPLDTMLEKLRLVVQNRDMPPWGADDTGLCGHWHGSPWLPPAEIDTIVRFVEKGGPMGKPPAVRASGSAATRTLRADALLDVGADDTPDLGDAAYRCFLVDPALARDRLLTGLEIRATDPRSVAQVTLYGLESADSEASASRQDARDDRPGWPCYGGPGVSGARPLGSWSWSQPTLFYPAGTGIRVSAGRKIVLQVHYNLVTAGLGTPTRVRAALQLDDGVTEARLVPLSAPSFTLPPEQIYADASAKLLVPAAWTLYGAAPRMHVLGKAMELRLGGQAGRCLANFGHWDFYRQQLFVYDDPVRLAAGDELDVHCTYNTQSRHVPTSTGDAITDEQCLLWLYVVP